MIDAGLAVFVKLNWFVECLFLCLVGVFFLRSTEMAFFFFDSTTFCWMSDSKEKTPLNIQTNLCALWLRDCVRNAQLGVKNFFFGTPNNLSLSFFAMKQLFFLVFFFLLARHNTEIRNLIIFNVFSRIRILSLLQVTPANQCWWWKEAQEACYRDQFSVFRSWRQYPFPSPHEQTPWKGSIVRNSRTQRKRRRKEQLTACFPSSQLAGWVVMKNW